MQKVIFSDLGNLPFREAWDLQTTLHKAIVEEKLALRHTPYAQRKHPHRLLFVEHPPVYTLGKSGSPENVLLAEPELREKNIDFFHINRGGDITFHGPGQLVAYPILDLELFFTDVHRYVRNLEEIVIRTLHSFDIDAGRIPGFTGVWLHDPPKRNLRKEEEAFFAHNRKICAIGVHLSRWVTLHGLAFNVNTELPYFDYIVPCGIKDADKTVTSLEKEIGAPVDINTIKAEIKGHFEEVFNCKLEEAQRA